MMTRRLALVLAGAFAMSALMVGPVQAVCDPHCSPKSNSGGAVKGLDRADAVAGDHGEQGRANAREKQGIVQTSPDMDGDGIPDAQDLCADKAAPGTSDGCPVEVLPQGPPAGA